MQLIKHLDYHYKIAIKVSSFGFDEDLIDALVEKCVGKNIRVIIDAEDNIHHDQYQDISNHVMQKHNKYIPYVVKTYQMYRKDGLETLERDLIDSRINNYHLGIKMVRGAYYHAEKKDGHLFTEKHLTDESYNKGILTIGQNNVNTYTILATHNFDSVRLGYMYNRYAKRRVFEFAHLMGMQEENYHGLTNNPQYDLAKKQQLDPNGEPGFGAMISIDLETLDQAAIFCKNLKIFTLAESLGGVESLICHPAKMTHASLGAEKRKKLGISDGLLTVSYTHLTLPTNREV